MGADRITQGIPSSAGTNSYDTNAIVQDVANNDLYVSGNAKIFKVMRKAMHVYPAATALTAITTAQVLLTENINAGRFNIVGRRVRVKGSLIYSTTAAAVATITLALTLGGVTLCTITTAATNTAASTNLPLQFEFELTVASLGAAGTIESHGRVDADIGTAAASAIASYLDTNTAVSAAVNLTSALTLNVTIAASAAIPSAQLRDAVLEIVA